MYATVSEFLKNVEDMGHFKLLYKAIEQYRFFKSKGEKDSAYFMHGFIFFMKNRMKPAGLSDDEFQKLKPFIEKRVAHGYSKPEILDLFD